ncbi:FixH family protein [Sphingobacterium faecale]|uniref:FixH family protein n=1 Tax=Sphingobacterium faecale TaxID=2803775 RepID=A0ABS1R9J4_9SPHI|nr:FixH family protein [Sphingobacterium faecale]MBL1411348.1 FixH family protein [Sphingobacterium faecale]
MNWGLRIVVGLGTFMLLIMGAGIYMVSQDTDSLVDEDYYEKSLVYDDVYKRKQNMIDDDVKPKLQLDGDTLTIVFKGDINKGEVNFKRPSDGSLDLKVPFYTQSNTFRLPVSTFSKGNWTLEVVWEHNTRAYFDSQSLFIP